MMMNSEAIVEMLFTKHGTSLRMNHCIRESNIQSEDGEREKKHQPNRNKKEKRT